MSRWPAETFRVRDALELGLGRELLRSEQLTSPFHGVRVVGRADGHDALCRAYATKMAAHAAFSSTTAARLWGIPLPRIGDPRLHVSSPVDRPQARGRGVVGHRHDAEMVSIAQCAGLRVLSPADAWCSLAGALSTPDLVAAADYLVTGLPNRAVPPLVDLADLIAAVDRRHHVPGVADLRRALRLTRVGAWSRPESLLRVAAGCAGLPEPELNAELGGMLVDLFWREFGVGAEYDGDHHRERTQHRADVHRHERIADGGVVLVHVTADDLFDRTSETVARIGQRLRGRGWLDRSIVRVDRIPELRR
jgi:hypothetical protein